MKKQFYNLFFILCILTFSPQNLKTQSPAILPPPPENMEELMKNVDFEQMLKELENIFGTDPEETTKPKPTATIPSIKKEEAKPAIPVKKETREESFKNSAKAEGKDETVVLKLPKEKLEAFNYYIDNFLIQIKKLDTNISSFSLGIDFKEQLEDLNLQQASMAYSADDKGKTNLGQQKKELLNSYKSIISNIEKNLGIIEGRKPHSKRKLYKKVFFLPMFTDLREQIIKITKELETINNQIVILEKSTEEEKEKAEIEELKALAEKRQISKTKVPDKLKKDIKQIFTNLKDIADKLEAITLSPQAKTLIETKKKKRDEDIKKAEDRRKAESRGYRSSYYPSHHSSGDWGKPGGYWQPPAYGGSGSWGGPSGEQYTPYRKPEETKPSEIKPSDDKKSPEERHSSAPKKDDKEKEKEKDKEITDNLSNNTIELINRILSTFKPDDEKSYNEILDSNSLSKITQNLEEISKLKAKTPIKKDDSESKQIAKTASSNSQKEQKFPSEQKLEDTFKKFAPVCIRLAKHHSGNQEQKDAAAKIIRELKTENLQGLINAEISKYEEAVLKKIKPEELSKYDPQDQLDVALKNLKIASNWPQSDPEKIKNVKEAVEDQVETGLKYNGILSDYLANPTRNLEAALTDLNSSWKELYKKEVQKSQDTNLIKLRLTRQKQKLEKIKAFVSEAEPKQKAMPKERGYGPTRALPPTGGEWIEVPEGTD